MNRSPAVREILSIFFSRGALAPRGCSRVSRCRRGPPKPPKPPPPRPEAGRLAGYEDVNDAERLRHDPAMRWIVGGKSGAEQCGFAESDGTLRDAMARGAQELRGSCPPVWPVDRPCARPKATPWHRARHGFKREPDPRRAGDERLERPLRLHLLSPAVRVKSVWRPRTLCSACRQRAQR